MDYRIEAMECGGCARGVTAAVMAADPQATLSIDVPTRTARIESTRQDLVREALAEAGFPAVPA